MNQIVNELRRRNVFRVAGIYAVMGWLLVQVAVAFEPALGLPQWFDAVVIGFLLIGFPVIILFAWAFEMTPEGVKLTRAVAAEESITKRTGRKLDYALLAGLLLVAAVIVGDRVIPRAEPVAAPAQAAETSVEAAQGVDLSDKSIAVLPFADLSPDGDQEYFADGLSEELLNVLAQIDELQVAGRTSAFAFKGDSRDLREIGELLNVAHILEGSVRKSGDRIRVTAQLINTRNGYHVFSDTYEGDVSDIFRVQDEIAAKITTALRTEWLGEESLDDAPSNVAAFDLYLKARQLIYTRDRQSMEEGERLLDRALEIDPAYAPAFAQKAIVNLLLSAAPGSYGDRPQVEAAAQSLSWADKAIAIDPTLGEAHAAKGLALVNSGAANSDVVGSLRRATELNPGLSDAKNWLASTLISQGKLKEAYTVYETLVETDPFYPPAFSNLIVRYTYMGDHEKAAALIARIERVSGETPESLMAKGFVAQSRGQLSQSVTLFGQALQQDPDSSVLRLYYVEELIRIGEYEKALSEAKTGQKALILMLMGRNADGDAAIESMPTPAEAGVAPLMMAMYAYGFSNRSEEAVAYLDRHFESLDDAVNLSLYDAGLWLPYAASAYRDTGRTDEFEQALDYLDQSLQTDRDEGGAHFDVQWIEAMLAAMQGDSDSAIGRLQSAQQMGMTDDSAFRPAAFDSIRQDPRFQAIEAENSRRVNEEREKMDLPTLSGM